MTSPRTFPAGSAARLAPPLAARLVAGVLALVVVACGQAVTSPSAAPATSAPGTTAPTAPLSAPPSAAIPTPAGSLGRDDGWRADIAALVPGMAAFHPALTHSVSRAELDAAATALAATVPTATDDELMVGVLGIVAKVTSAGCDAHTGAFVWGSGTYPVDSLPLRLWLFEDDVVVVDALAPFEHLVGARIDTIEGHPTADVIAAIDPIVPRDNAQTVRLLMPRFLLVPQILRGLDLADEGAISLGLTPVEGAPATVDVEPIPIAEYNAWAGGYGLHLPADPDVTYLSRIGDALWWEVLDDDETLYVQYNRVDRLTATQVTDLTDVLEDASVSRILLDIRHNFGGELSALDAITPILVDAADGDAARLFVLIGRNTFSAGSMLAARLDRDAQATLVGEPTGGCPTIWSDPSDLLLPFSGITVSVAGDVAVGVDPNDTRLTVDPDVEAVLTVDEWADGIDPALELFDVEAP
jgi:Peptidase family S41